MNAEAMVRFVSALEPAFRHGDAALDAKSTEQANVGQVRALFEAIRQQDWEAMGALLGDDIQLEITGPPGMPLAGRWEGRDAALQAAATNFAQLEDQEPEILSLVAQGDSVALLARERGRLQSTGQEYDVRWVQFYTLRDGRITHLLEFCDDPGALTSG